MTRFRFHLSLRHRRDDLDARVASARAGAETAREEARRSRARQEQVRESVVTPLREAAEHNQFAEMIRRSLIEGRSELRKWWLHVSQDKWLLLLFKIILPADILSVLAFVIQYTLLAKWWRNEIGRTLVAKDILLVLALLPSVLSLFLHFNRATSNVAAWADIAMFGLLAPVMIWRITVFQKIHNGHQVEDGPAPEEADAGQGN